MCKVIEFDVVGFKMVCSCDIIYVGEFMYVLLCVSILSYREEEEKG